MAAIGYQFHKFVSWLKQCQHAWGEATFTVRKVNILSNSCPTSR
jgi:hypothetical protein